jgi:hypothetical protein
MGDIAQQAVNSLQAEVAKGAAAIDAGTDDENRIAEFQLAGGRGHLVSIQSLQFAIFIAQSSPSPVDDLPHQNADSACRLSLFLHRWSRSVNSPWISIRTAGVENQRPKQWQPAVVPVRCPHRLTLELTVDYLGHNRSP